MANRNFNWDAISFFKKLTETNRFAIENGFEFRRVSSLEGFHGSLSGATSTLALVAVSDDTQGKMSLANSPSNKRAKTVFMAMRHAVDSDDARDEAFAIMNELFSQFLSKLILEKTQLEQNCIYLEDEINFTEIDKYFVPGAACAFFNIAIKTFTDLRYNPDEWLPEETTT